MNLNDERGPVRLPPLPAGRHWPLPLVIAAIESAGVSRAQAARWAQRPEVSRRLPAGFSIGTNGSGQG